MEAARVDIIKKFAESTPSWVKKSVERRTGEACRKLGTGWRSGPQDGACNSMLQNAG